jgi:tRNA G37 N-methylase Trm5
MIILPERAFESDDWVKLLNRCTKSQLEALWRCIAEALSGKRLARQRPIAKDMFRSSQTELLFGENGWVEFTDHGVQFGFDATQVMFS